MTTTLAYPIAAYIEAKNAQNATAVSECFNTDATVRDEKRTWQGRAAIRAWAAEASAKYQPSVEVLEVADSEDSTVMRGKVSGNFPGSPIELRFLFRLKGDGIEALEIR